MPQWHISRKPFQNQLNINRFNSFPKFKRISSAINHLSKPNQLKQPRLNFKSILSFTSSK
ncbi:uncharacterized protein DS421_19g665810 [Arachis hypogaea]|uniref:Uncharacterized protein n=1 Tax=Arachis hypogaea TaxID=3818 RepID=A0A6B9VF52_ARAHY|nr:uncharacterized protein DS421_19g665800 [Arachis hypogaea]QHN78943.1 uncharacterized protein DS421_19g665810 [Arachis hypogaea]